MTKFKNKNRKLALTIALVFLAIPVLNVIINSSMVEGVSPCEESAKCQEAVKKEKEAKAKAEAATDSASAYQAKVEELSSEIEGKETEIKQTEKDIKSLKKQIEIIEEKLADDQEALAELLVNMHFESDAEPIRILAGATSISDLAEKAAREETVKEQISVTATEVKNAKDELEEDKAKVEALLEKQQTARKTLVSKRSEQKSLVEKYQNDAEAYNEIAKEEAKKRQAAIEEEMKAHPQKYTGNTYIGDGTNTYPWAGDCPGRQDAYGTVIGGRYIGGLVCECVSYAGWKAYEAYGLIIAWGNAYNWDDRARGAGYVVNHSPSAGTIGQFDDGPYGHVFWVESINGDGSVNVTEYNNAYATQIYSGSYHYGDFGARTITAGEAARYNYIHLR